MKKLQAFIHKANGTFGKVEISPSGELKKLQSLVGGYIEIIGDNPEYDIVLNEEGRINGSELNPFSKFIAKIAGKRWEDTLFYGDVVIILGKLL